VGKFGRLIYLVGGLAFGAVLFWLLLRQISPAEISQVLHHIGLRAVAIALFFYAMALLLRSARWRILLRNFVPASYWKVVLVLVIGYAINSLLPARIGELIRAEQAKSKFRLSLSTALGTIAIERLIDGLVVVAMLAVGLLAVPLGAEHARMIYYLLGTSVILFGSLTVLFLFLSGSRTFKLLDKSSFAASKINKFREGLAVMRSQTIILVLGWTILVWMADGTSLWFALNAANMSLTIPQLLLTIGIVSLSQLLPTAPGFVGTLQLAFVISITTFGYTSAQGFAAATTLQVFILGSLCLVGISLMLINHVGLVFNPSGASETAETPASESAGQA
jgi:glycosyltransferase 2 family protein